LSPLYITPFIDLQSDLVSLRDAIGSFRKGIYRSKNLTLREVLIDLLTGAPGEREERALAVASG
jgi:hypothetical protein